MFSHLSFDETSDDATKLMQVGFEFHFEMDGKTVQETKMTIPHGTSKNPDFSMPFFGNGLFTRQLFM